MSLENLKRRFVRVLRSIFKKKKRRGLNMNWKDMEWDYVEELESDSIIEEFEAFVGYTFPEDYKECVKLYNGGAPEYTDFDVKNESIGTTCIDYLYSFNKDASESIWDLYGWDEFCEETEGLIGKYIAFAGDSGGNSLCFDTETNHIVFVDHETLEIEELADTFTEFINLLYEYEDED